MAWSVYKSDSFNRADSGSLGSSYPSGGADFSIVSNQCVIPQTAIDKAAMWSDPAGDFTVYPDQSSSALIYCSNTGSIGGGPGVMVRQDVSGVDTRYRLVVCGGGGGNNGLAELGRFIANSYTMLAQYTGFFNFVTGARLTLRVTGQGTSTILSTIYNGESFGTYNDNSGSALNTGQPGIAYSSEVIGTNKWDDWEGGIWTPDAAVVPPISIPTTAAQPW